MIGPSVSAVAHRIWPECTFWTPMPLTIRAKVRNLRTPTKRGLKPDDLDIIIPGNVPTIPSLGDRFTAPDFPGDYRVLRIAPVTYEGTVIDYRILAVSLAGGDRQIILREPTRVTTDEYGEKTIADTNEHTTPAYRYDLTGEESEVAVERFLQKTRWEVRRTSALNHLDPSWSLIGDDNHQYEIESVAESMEAGELEWHIMTHRLGAVK